MADPSIVDRVRTNATEIASTLVTGIRLAAFFMGRTGGSPRCCPTTCRRSDRLVAVGDESGREE